MIHEKTLNAVMPITEIPFKSTTTGGPLRLRAMPNSPLDELCVNSSPTTVKVNGELTDGSPYRISEASKVKGPNGISEHDATMDEVVAVVAQSVQGSLDIARNVVNPIIKSVVELTEKGVDAQQSKLLQPLSVIQDVYHSIWGNPILEGMVERYEGTPAISVEGFKGMPELDGDKLQELALTGVDRFDGDLKDLLANKDPSWLAELYNVVFRTNQVDFAAPGFNLALLEDMLAKPQVWRDEIVVAHCLSRNLKDNVPEGTHMDLLIYRDHMATVISQTGRAILKVFRQRDRARNNNELILQWPLLNIDYIAKDGGNILVNSEVYLRWLKEGGSPEILFGAFVTDKERGYKTLLEQADRYREAWKRQERIIATEVRFERNNQTISALRHAVSMEINNLDSDLMVVERAVLHERLNRCLTEVKSKDLENLYCVARRLVCQTMFAHTDAERILEAIDAAAEANPELDIRRAALLATIEIVTDWIACMIQVDDQ